MGFRDTLKKWDEEDKKAGGIDLPDVSEIFPTEPAAASAQAYPTTSPRPTTDYRTTTATNPEEAKKIAADKAKESNDTTAFGYGVARSGTLGAVDRLAGLGTLIGEHLGASDEVPARPGAYQEGRKEYLEGEDKSRKISPWYHFGGEVVGGAAALPLAPESAAGRLALAGGTAALSGAMNTRQDDAKEMASNAAKAGGVGVLTQKFIGDPVRNLIRNAPQRELNRTTGAVVESEFGRVNPKPANAIARDVRDVQDVLKSSPEVRKAIQNGPKESRPLIQQKMDAARVGQPERYAMVDETIAPLTVTQVLNKLVKAEGSVPTGQIELVKPVLEKMRDSLRQTFAPRWSGQATWNGARVQVPTEELRSWVSSAQKAGELALVGVSPSAAAEAKGIAAKIANGILEDHLDAAAKKGGKAMSDAVEQIRESDRVFSAWKNIDTAQEALEKKVLAQNAGLNARLAHAGREASDQAAVALASSGNLVPAMAMAAKSRLAENVQQKAKFINDNVLIPMQLAAERGAAWGEISRMAAETGLPQGVARALFDRTREKGRIKAAAPQNLPIPAPDAVPLRNTAVVQSVPEWPKDYRTSTRTQ